MAKDLEADAAKADETSDSQSQKSKSTEATDRAVQKAAKKTLNFTLRDPTAEEYKNLKIMRLNW